MGASESKLEFKEDIFRLAGEDNIPIESSWWARFIQLPESAEDVQALWSPNDLRNLTLSNPADRPLSNIQTAPKKNAETLIYRTISRLHALQTKRVYDDPHAPIAPEVLNGLRILTRLLPYIYEADHLSEWEDRFFWQPRKAVAYSGVQNERCVYRDGLSEQAVAEEQKDTVLGPALGEQLVDILINYLFFPGFTVPARRDANGLPDLRPIYAVWQSGIGANKGLGMTKENEKNAVEVLRLLIVLTSRTMYLPAGVVADIDIKPLTYLTTKSDRSVVLNMICSLLNTVLKYNQNPWTLPIDIPGATKDSRQSLVTCCLHLMFVLITYPVPNAGANEFRKALGRLHRAEDFQFVVEGLRQILIQPTSGMLRGVQRLTTQSPPVAPETLSLFWELLQCNKRFRSYLIDTERARDFVVLVLYYAVEAKDDPARQGIVRMCVFILQTLSVEEKFGKKLNAQFAHQETLPGVLQIPNFHGSYADFLIGHIHALLTSGNRGLESLHPALLAIINNIAPQLQGIERATSSMLLSMFSSMAQPSFLLANETNHVQLASLLDAISAILDHQHADNKKFVDLVVKNRKRFEALRDFTVEGAEQELHRMTMERKDTGDSTGATSPRRSGSLESARSAADGTPRPLGSVPEDSAFAIGEDENDENEAVDDEHGATTPTTTSRSSVDDAVPAQSRSMSEKARGKQPISYGNLARLASQNNSNSSLPSLNTSLARGPSQAFSPSQEWLHTWVPYLPLHSILDTINRERTRNLRSPTTEQPEQAAKDVKVQTFKWTSPALGWYLSLLWGRIYSADTARIWAGTHIRLFNVLSHKNEISLRSPMGAVDAVGNSIVKRIGSLSLTSSSQPTSREV